MAISANVAEAVITPPIGVEMIEPRGVPSTAVHDDLYVRAISLGDGAATVCVVTMDLLGLDAGLLEQVRSAVEQQTGLARERLMLTASHNHSAPLTIPYDVTVQPRRDRDWEAQLVRRIADTVAQAQTAMLPVSLAAGRADVQVGLNRRLSTLTGTTMAPNPAGPVAPWVDILRVDRSGDVPLAVLFSHAAHPVTVHSTATEFTADYPGAAAVTIRDSLGAGVTPLFAQGCAADINVEPLRGGFAEAQRAGMMLGQAAVAAASQAPAITGGTVRAATETVHLDFELMSADVCRAIIQRLQESYATLQAGGADDRSLDQHTICLAWARKMLGYAREPQHPAGLSFQVQAFALGRDLALVGLSHEPFVEYQLFLQQESPFPHTMVFGYTNGCESYVPTADACYLEGYEAYGAQRLYGVPRLQPGCEQKVKQTCLQVLSELWRRAKSDGDRAG